MQVDSLIVQLRPRAPFEAADLGARLCQQAAGSVYRCYAAVAVPLMVLCIASFEIAWWLPGVALWCCKPWLDRTVLFVLSRAAFGQPTALGELWDAQQQVWWGQLILTFTLQRLSPWRSLTQPVYQLEGLSLLEAGKRVLQVRGQNMAIIGGFLYWIATHTYWADQVAPGRLSGEALRDPFYAAEHLAGALGAHPSYQRLWRLPARNGIVVTASWEWDRSNAERAQLKHWVESGGRLVADLSLLGDQAFSDWSGISRYYIKTRPGGCREEEERGASLWPASATPGHYELCGLHANSYLFSTRAPVWQVFDAYGAQALRVRIGKGSVSVVNGAAFVYLRLLEGTNAAIFVAAAQLHAGDTIYFLSDRDHASLLALGWRFGAPVVVLLLGALGLALWRAAPRFGPAMPSPESARRSLAEQIRGTGHFLLRAGDGEVLHAATARALFAAAARRISAFPTLSDTERVSRIARETGFSPGALAAAIHYTGARRANELRSAIALLEAARREILRNNSRSADGY
ncbi:MAG: hypothetical protein ACRETZ_04170 [Steroidobacteraceae bacterium]